MTEFIYSEAFHYKVSIRRAIAVARGNLTGCIKSCLPLVTVRAAHRKDGAGSLSAVLPVPLLDGVATNATVSQPSLTSPPSSCTCRPFTEL